MKFLLIISLILKVAFACFDQQRLQVENTLKDLVSVNNGWFHLTIVGEPEYYVAKSLYVVGIEGYDEYEFNSFILTVESTNTSSSPSHVGWFHLLPKDSNTQFNADCINSINEQTQDPKNNIQVLWTAPSTGSGCVTFKAIAVINKTDGMYMEYMNRSICQVVEEKHMMVDVVEPEKCCACDEATYRMTFEGLWTKETHRKNFPTQLSLTHFSDIIGATHTPSFSVWAEGKYATEGFRQLAEWGSVGIMEAELRDQKKYLRTLIKMAGLFYPKVNTNTTGKFRVDRKHNLLSIASMLGPSPDWIVGVHDLNLCEKSCTWIEDKVIDLYPYDAGTDSGISYMSPNAQTIPQERIYRITDNYPEDPRAPFYNQTINPLVRLYLKREHLTKMSCNSTTLDEMMNEVNVFENTENLNTPECAVTNYTNWTPCSVSCGKGIRSRTRNYVDKEKAVAMKCDRQLVSKEMCVAEIATCPGDVEEDNSLFLENENCKTSKWSGWSECSESCGIGVMTRTRHLQNRSAFKKCRHVQLTENKKCMEPPCKIPKTKNQNTLKCTTGWSNWSPCTATCGRGERIRIKHMLLPLDKYPECGNETLEERKPCVILSDCIISKTLAADVCQLPPAQGPCRGIYHRWYFDVGKKQCIEFTYGGCRGNSNNFLTQDECLKSCLIN